MAHDTKEQASKLLAHITNGDIMNHVRLGQYIILTVHGVHHNGYNVKLHIKVDIQRQSIDCTVDTSDNEYLTSKTYRFTKPTFDKLVTQIEKVAA